MSRERPWSGTAMYAAQIVGSILLIFGEAIGLDIAAVAMVILAAYSVSGAWLLLVGAHRSQDAA